jgi:hypothetical protein
VVNPVPRLRVFQTDSAVSAPFWPKGGFPMKRPLTVLAAIAAVTLCWPGSASAASTWAIQATPLPPGATQGALQGVSCSTASRCTAVGFYLKHNESQSLAEAWDGTAWTVQTTPLPTALDSRLDAVSCASSTSCTAVGFFQVAANDPVQPLAEHWTGSAWAIEPAPAPAGAVGGALLGVSCASAANCTAAGYYIKAIGSNQLNYALAEHWNGRTWSIQASPKLPRSQLFAVSCTSARAARRSGATSPSLPTAAS